MDTKFTIVQTGDTLTVRDSRGTLIALATFACPRRPEDCARVMRDRAEFVRRFS
jgi:hypothetical protein